MTITIRGILFATLVLLACIEFLWQQIGHLNVEAKSLAWPVATFVIFATSAALYDWIRKDACISSMLFGVGFITIYGAVLNVMSYFGLTIAGPRIDYFLASLDRATGIYWPALIAFAARHPTINIILLYVYQLSVWQTLIVIAALGHKDRVGTVEQLCLALVLCGIITIGVWTMFPSFGAITVYGLPADIAGKLPLSLDQNYAHELLRLWTNGPGLISPLAVKGLIGFPSFHTAQAVIVTWYARRIGVLFYPFLVFNILTVLSTPIQGGHHVVDVVGGFAVAALAILLTTKIAKRLARMKVQKEAVPTWVAAG